tara:strand:+ start:240 stop:383 length:144 start_codon:yes stop_codon:yes gene_type:complete
MASIANHNGSLAGGLVRMGRQIDPACQARKARSDYGARRRSEERPNG